MKCIERVPSAVWPFVLTAAVTLVLSGCVSGGILNSRKTPPYEVLAHYRPESGGPAAEYYLVKTEKGLGLLEKDQSGNQALATTHWQAHDGDHFAIWGSFLSRQVAAFEYVVPFDRLQAAKRFAYAAGNYSIVRMDGIDRPVPVNPASHSPVQLIPVPLGE